MPGTSTVAAPTLRLLPEYQDVTIEQITRYRRHWYKVSGFDDLLPSVTSVMKVIDTGGGLMGSAMKLMGQYVHGVIERGEVYDLGADEVVAKAKAYPRTVWNTKRDDGTAAHELVQARLQGETPPIPDHLLPAVSGASKMVSDYRLDTEAVEHAVWHPTYGYAGTIDLVARDPDGRLVVLDWKRASGIYDENAEQLGAYVVATQVLTGELVGAAYVVRLPQEPESEPYECRQVDIPQAFARFLAAFARWKAANEGGSVWLS